MFVMAKSKSKWPHFFDALHPVLDVFEGLLVSDVVHQDDALKHRQETQKPFRRLVERDDV